MSHRIIVDVMGADNGSVVVIRGAVAGARRSGASLLLVGNRTVIQNELEGLKTKGLDIQIPVNYYPDGNPENKPLLTWRACANNLYTNWLNYYVYQVTPYDLYGTPF